MTMFSKWVQICFRVKSPNFIRCWLGIAQCLLVDEELNS